MAIIVNDDKLPPDVERKSDSLLEAFMNYPPVGYDGKITKYTDTDKGDLSLVNLVKKDYDKIFYDSWEEELALAVGFWCSAINEKRGRAAITEGVRSIAGNTGTFSFASSCGCRSIAASTEEFSGAICAEPGTIAATTGNSSVSLAEDPLSLAVASGEHSAAIAVSCSSTALTTDEMSLAKVQADNSVAIALGRDSYASGSLGSWLVLAEWKDGKRIDVKTFLVDGETILPDTPYTLKNSHAVSME